MNDCRFGVSPVNYPEPMNQNLPNEGVPKHSQRNIRQFLSKHKVFCKKVILKGT